MVAINTNTTTTTTTTTTIIVTAIKISTHTILVPRSNYTTTQVQHNNITIYTLQCRQVYKKVAPYITPNV